jgi:hypothetical protein
MPRAAQRGSRVRSTGTVLGVRLLVLDVARHGSLAVLRRWSTQAETPETGHRHVYRDHFEPNCPYRAIEEVGQRHAGQFAQRRIVETVASAPRGRDIAGRTGFHVHADENIAACTTATASNTVAAPPKSAIQRSWFTRQRRPHTHQTSRTGWRHQSVGALQVTWSQRTCPGRSLLFAVRKCPLSPHVHCEGPPHGIPADQENRQAPLVRG